MGYCLLPHHLRKAQQRRAIRLPQEERRATKASRFSDAQKAFILKQGSDRKAGISQATYFYWKRKYDGLLPTEMRQLKQAEDENSKLRKVVADLSLDKEKLQDVISAAPATPSDSSLRKWRDGRARDSFRTCRYCAARPSIWCWRDHSAGKSARRATPMPCGSRPSMAAVTRSGARKASEIVIFTLRTLHLSR